MNLPLPLDLIAHPQRDTVLGEVHARPFQLVRSPRRFLHFAFTTSPEAAKAACRALITLCERHNVPAPKPDARHHRAELGDMILRFESHAEFCTYTFGCNGEGTQPFMPLASQLVRFTDLLPQPGPHLVSVDLHLMKLPADAVGLHEQAVKLEEIFDRASLAASHVAHKAGVVATDFRPNHQGFVRLLVGDLGMSHYRAGALVQRLLEIETYRTLALLGLPTAQAMNPAVQQMEDQLIRIAHDMKKVDGLAADRVLLDQMTGLSAALEADAASANFRFRASAAYDSIVQQRLVAIREESWEDFSSLSSFLSRRMAPAMRTCAMLQERQSTLSEKLARATNLLRTRVDVEIEEQNRNMLRALNERTRLQLRLQQTVEGLSVAAISYYIVALAAKLFEGLKEVGWLHIEPAVATALAVPVVVGLVAYIVHRIRSTHSDDH